MGSPFIIPLSAFALVVLIVAITQLATIRDRETDVAAKIHQEEMEHRRKMKELDDELTRLKQAR